VSKRYENEKWGTIPTNEEAMTNPPATHLPKEVTPLEVSK
jgi:hypothetical protein